VLVLRLVQGMTPTAIAHSLGCPVATVKTRLQRGLVWLRKALPAGIASSVAVLITTGRGLAAVRHEVLAQVGARGSVLAVGGLVGGILAGVAMKKLVTGMVALAVCAALFCMSLRPPGDRDTPPRAMADAGAAERGDLATSRAGPPVESSANVRVPAAADAPALPGSAALQFVWKGTELVAPHLQVWWRKDRDESAGRLHPVQRVDLAGGPACRARAAQSSRRTSRIAETANGARHEVVHGDAESGEHVASGQLRIAGKARLPVRIVSGDGSRDGVDDPDEASAMAEPADDLLLDRRGRVAW